MTTLYTPGPWSTEVLGNTLRVIDRAGNDIALVGDCRQGTNRANARLIVQAPDMLAALRSMLIYNGVDSHAAACLSNPTWMSGASAVGPCDCCYGEARAAIAEAEGGQQ